MEESVKVPMTIDNLNEYLPKIGWSIKGNRLNRYMYNGFGKRTMFRIIGTERFEIPYKELFGKGGGDYVNSGCFCMYFKDCEIELHFKEDGKTSDFISLCAKGLDGVFINLYKKDD